MVTDENGTRALNACILFLPQMNGKALRTVEGISGPDGALHPVQQAMVDHHGSQCGFCTPGFIASMATAQKWALDHDDQLATCAGAQATRRLFAQPRLQPKSQFPTGWTMQSCLTARIRSALMIGGTLRCNPDATVAGATDVGLWITKQLRELPNAIFLNRCKELSEIK